jgi:hypothetical protein
MFVVKSPFQGCIIGGANCATTLDAFEAVLMMWETFHTCLWHRQPTLVPPFRLNNNSWKWKTLMPKNLHCTNHHTGRKLLHVPRKRALKLEFPPFYFEKPWELSDSIGLAWNSKASNKTTCTKLRACSSIFHDSIHGNTIWAFPSLFKSKPVH